MEVRFSFDKDAAKRRGHTLEDMHQMRKGPASGGAKTLAAGRRERRHRKNVHFRSLQGDSPAPNAA